MIGNRKATEILKEEHRVIERVLDCLEVLVERSLTGGALDARGAREAVEFLRGFADRFHQRKEETRLFPLLEGREFSARAEPISGMLREHRQGRAHLRAMDGAIEGAAAGDTTSLDRFAVHARTYVDLLREHIRKEDHLLFPVADDVLTAVDQYRLLDGFASVEAEEVGHGAQERLRSLADGLTERLSVPERVGLGSGG